MGRRTGGLWFGLPSLSEPSDYDNLGEFYWRQLLRQQMTELQLPERQLWPSCFATRVSPTRSRGATPTTKNNRFQ